MPLPCPVLDVVPRTIPVFFAFYSTFVVVPCGGVAPWAARLAFKEFGDFIGHRDPWLDGDALDGDIGFDDTLNGRGFGVPSFLVLDDNETVAGYAALNSTSAAATDSATAPANATAEAADDNELGNLGMDADPWFTPMEGLEANGTAEGFAPRMDGLEGDLDHNNISDLVATLDVSEGVRAHDMVAFVRLPAATSKLFESTLMMVGMRGDWLQDVVDMSGHTRRSPCDDADWMRPRIDTQKCDKVKDNALVQVGRHGYCEPLVNIRSCRYVTLLREPISQMIAAYSLFCSQCAHGRSLCRRGPNSCPHKSFVEFADNRLNLITRTFAGAMPEGKDLLHGYFDGGGFKHGVTRAHYTRAWENLHAPNMLALAVEDFIKTRQGRSGGLRNFTAWVGDVGPINQIEKQWDEIFQGPYRATDQELQRLKRLMKWDLMLYWSVAARKY